MGAAWEAFTACSPGESARDITVRELNNQSGRYDWPADEVTNGAAGLHISSHGDDPAGAFVKAWGPDREAVEACLDRLVAFVNSGAVAALYGDGAP